MQIPLGKWSGLALCAARERNPVKERTRVNVEKLPEEILIHEQRRDLVPSNRELKAAVESDGVDRRRRAAGADDDGLRVGRARREAGGAAISRGDRMGTDGKCGLSCRPCKSLEFRFGLPAPGPGVHPFVAPRGTTASFRWLVTFRPLCQRSRLGD